MYNVYVSDMEFEQCKADKERINLIIPYTVFHFVLSGSGFVNGCKTGENTVFISNKDSLVDYYPAEDDPWSYVYVRFFGDDMKKVFADYDFMPETTILKFNKRKELFHLLALYKSLCDYDNFDARTTIANAILLLFKKTQGTAGATGEQEKHARDIKNYIDENYRKNLTVQSVSDKFFLSKGYVRNLFVKFYDVSPKQYIQSVRMNRAKELIMKTETSIKLIASSVGYDDQLLFSRMFAKYYGMSPAKYRMNSKSEC